MIKPYELMLNLKQQWEDNGLQMNVKFIIKENVHEERLVGESRLI